MVRNACLLACLSLLLMACASARVSQRSLSPEEQQNAIERGHALERGSSMLESGQEAVRYRLVHVTEGRGPRVHVNVDVSVLVLSGRVRLLLGDENCTQAGVHLCELKERELSAGESVDVERGTLYLVENDEPHGSSLFFVFGAPHAIHLGPAERGSISGLLP